MSTKIVHIADVHWRGLSRHDEYRKTFTNFFNQVREISPDIIYVGGDIVHSKTQGISPELIDCLVWWFNEMAEICPTHVILGNHDGILLNKDRQDAITPVVKAINHPNLHLYKKSGVYQLKEENINLCVFSCFDEDNWHTVKPLDEGTNIALYHGAVWKSKTDSDWEIEGDVEVEFFDKFDFALLGDIHRTQFLTKDKRVAYCGSTIQQNYGESVGKGFLLWDIEDKNKFDVSFHEVKHNMPFVTVDWQSTVEETVKASQAYPDGARFRVRTTERIPHTEKIQIKNELNLTRSASEVVFQDKFMPTTSNIEVLDEHLKKSDLKNLDTQIKLLQEHLKESKLSISDWEDIESIMRKHMKEITRKNLSPGNKKWSINKIDFSNTFGYGERNSINFKNLSGIVGIFGKNRKGKSSVIGSLVYGLYNTSDRGAIKNVDIINTRKDYCRATIDLEAGGDLIRVDRQSVKKKNRAGEISATTHLNLWRLDEEGNEIEDLSGEQRRQTEKRLRRIIGTSNDFLITSLASQGEINAFIKDRATARKAILTKFLGLDVFDDLYRSLKDESAEVKALVKGAPDRDWSALISEKEAQIEKLVDENDKIDKSLASARDDLQKAKLDLAGFKHKDVVTPHDISRKQEELSELCDALKTAVKSKLEAQEELTLLQIEMESNKKQLKEINISELRESKQELTDVSHALRDMQFEYKEEKKTLDRKIKSAALLSEAPCGDQFPTCKFIKNSHRDKGEIESQRKKVEDFESRIKATESVLNRLRKENVESEIKRFESLKKAIDRQDLEVSKKKHAIVKLVTKIDQTRANIDSLESTIESMKSCVIDEESSKEIDELKRKISDLEKNVNKLDSKRITNASVTGSTKSEIKSLKKEREQYKKLRKKWRLYDLLIQSVSKRGIPLQIMRSQLPIINAEIAKILHDVVNFSIELEAEPDSNAMDVYIDYGDSKRIIELGSGMEKLIASLAIRVALINVSSLPKADMLIIDESFGVLDDTSVEDCNRMLVSLKRWFKTILIITHVDSVKDVVDNVIDIELKGKDAHIVYK